MMYKDKGIVYGNYIIDRLGVYLNENIGIKVETFYNCRELGYVLRAHNKDYSKKVNIWIYAHRNSDEPTITWGQELKADNMFTENEWINYTKSYSNINDAFDKVVSIFKKELDVELD